MGEPVEYLTLFQTVVGSHVWGMNTPQSDKDVYKVYLAPSEDFLIGKMHTRGHENQSDEVDVSSFEIGHVIQQLKKGNLNHLIGVMSPLIEVHSEEHKLLRMIVKDNLGKNCFHSIRGMAAHNYKRYFEDNCKLIHEPKAYHKKLGQVGRVVQFGIMILTYQKIEFKAHQPSSRHDIQVLLKRLEEALADSKLPGKPDDAVYDDFLLRLRLENLKDKPAHIKDGELDGSG